MAKWGKVDYKQFENLQKKMQRLQAKDQKAFMEACAKELAARLLAKVIKRTPVGEYPDEAGKKGGTLRRGWTGGEKASAKAFVDAINVTHEGGMYQIEIINPVEYASYVEYGHRTRDHKGWVPGRFMLTISEQELDAQAPKILEGKLMKYLGECFDD